MRYTVSISFHTRMFENSNDIRENVKTKKEAEGYKDLIDGTVSRAKLIDNVTGREEIWK
jgi:hypothetical protein